LNQYNHFEDIESQTDMKLTFEYKEKYKSNILHFLVLYMLNMEIGMLEFIC